MIPRRSRAPHLPLFALLLLALLVLVPACGGGGGGDADSGDVDAGDDGDTGDTGDGGDAGGDFVRFEIHSAPPDWIDDYRAGVALMKTRPTTDPTSWQYQANIHGVPGSFSACPRETASSQTAWATCQHGQFFFLAWHRMYLYYFERIVRDAVDEATNGQRTDWTLPYWDYEQFHALPEPFRVPADGSNSLFVSERAGNCNAGQDSCVTASTASASQALATIPVCSCPSGQASCDGCLPNLLPSQTFFGGWVPGATHFGSVTGELESQPHNVVHNAVGGFGGWMADPNCAARDPIFWLHHANIDRLWQVWLNEGGGRVDPIASATWRDEVFTFFDVENGMTVERQMTGCEILDMATQLDYVYQGLPVENVVLCGGPQPATASVASVEAPRVLATQESSVGLGRGRASLSLKVPVSATASAVGEDEEYRVVVDDLELLTHGAFYQVYLNLPEGTEPDPEGPHFIGNLALFGHVPQQVEEGHEPVRYSRSYDISDKVRELSARGEWTGDVDLTFVRGNPAPATAAAEPDTFIRVGKISVQHRD